MLSLSWLRRRLFQFRLRTLLLAVLAVSVALGWYVRRVELQRQAVDAIRQAGGTTYYDYQFVASEDDIYDFGVFADVKTAPHVWWLPRSWQARLGEDYFHGVEYVELQPGKRCDKEVLDRLVNLPHLQLLFLEGLNDRDLELIARLTHLRGLVITETQSITDVGIAELAGMRNLEMIALHGGPRITDSSIEVFASLPKLTTLVIAGGTTSGTCIGLPGLKHLAGMTSLKNLRLETKFTLIVDHDLAELRGMQRLERLMLGGFDISERGLDSLAQLKSLKELHLVDSIHPSTSRLKQALPGCFIEP